MQRLAQVAQRAGGIAIHNFAEQAHGLRVTGFGRLQQQLVRLLPGHRREAQEPLAEQAPQRCRRPWPMHLEKLPGMVQGFLPQLGGEGAEGERPEEFYMYQAQ